MFEDLPLGEVGRGSEVDCVSVWVHENLLVVADLKGDEIGDGDLAGLEAGAEEGAMVEFVVCVEGAVVVVGVEGRVLHFDYFVVGFVVFGFVPDFFAEFLRWSC